MTIYRTISSKGLAFLIKREGKKNHAYRDSGMFLTIGVGHLINRSESHSGKIKIGNSFIKYSQGLTDEQVKTLLEQDISKYESSVSLVLHESEIKEWEIHQVDALISFAFNVGRTAFESSTLAKRLIEGKIDDIPNQLRRWVYTNGKRSLGLINRRNYEISLFAKGNYS